MKNRRLWAMLLAAMVLLSSCSRANSTETEQQTETDSTVTESATGTDTSAQSATETREEATADATAVVVEAGDMFTSRDLDWSYTASECVSITLADNASVCEDKGVSISGNTVTISKEGIYILTGTLTDGQIVVEATKSDKIQLVLDGVDITSATSAAIYVVKADKVFITTAEGSENTLTNGGEYVAIDDNNIDSVIFSKADLTLNGSGTLVIQAGDGHGVVSKDDLKVTGGTYQITAVGHALNGKDSVRIAGGTFTLVAGKDGIHAENDEDTSLGFVYIVGGSFTITAEGDGITAGTYLQIEAGSFTIESGGGSDNASSQSSGQYYSMRGQMYYSQAESTSTKGLKAEEDIILSGGTFVLDCQDDGIHANGNLTISGGTCTIASGDDGLHADDGVYISGGNVEITESYEGIEGATIEISGGTIVLASSDDGLNANGGNDSSGYMGWSQDIFSSSSGSACITISGGNITIVAGGDGIDSNGDLYVSGGITYVFGPTDSANGALDHGGDAAITGGIVVATSSSSMEEIFESDSTQGCMMISVGSSSAGTEISLADSDGNVLVSFTAQKSYSRVIISCPELAQGNTYTLTNGSSSVEITMSSLIYTASASSSSGGMSSGGMSSGSNRQNMQGGRR